MKRILFMIICAAVGGALCAQEAVEPEGVFSTIQLGMTMEEVKSALSDDPSFLFRGDPDVSLLPSTGQPIIQTDGSAFIDRAILQFDDDRLYILSLLLDETRLDYFSVYRALVEKYGDPVDLDPGQAFWQSDSVRLSLERPLTVKYIDRATFNAIVESGEAEESLEQLTREEFLGQL